MAHDVSAAGALLVNMLNKDGFLPPNSVGRNGRDASLSLKVTAFFCSRPRVVPRRNSSGDEMRPDARSASSAPTKAADAACLARSGSFGQAGDFRSEALASGAGSSLLGGMTSGERSRYSRSFFPPPRKLRIIFCSNVSSSSWASAAPEKATTAQAATAATAIGNRVLMVRLSKIGMMVLAPARSRLPPR